MRVCNHCQEKSKELTKGYCVTCYPLYCCETCGTFVDEEHRLCEPCWEESDEYVED